MHDVKCFSVVAAICFPVTCMDIGSGFFHCSCFKSQTHLLRLLAFVDCPLGLPEERQIWCGFYLSWCLWSRVCGGWSGMGLGGGKMSRATGTSMRISSHNRASGSGKTGTTGASGRLKALGSGQSTKCLLEACLQKAETDLPLQGTFQQAQAWSLVGETEGKPPLHAWDPRRWRGWHGPGPEFPAICLLQACLQGALLQSRLTRCWACLGNFLGPGIRQSGLQKAVEV